MPKKDVVHAKLAELRKKFPFLPDEQIKARAKIDLKFEKYRKMKVELAKSGEGRRPRGRPRKNETFSDESWKITRSKKSFTDDPPKNDFLKFKVVKKQHLTPQKYQKIEENDNEITNLVSNSSSKESFVLDALPKTPRDPPPILSPMSTEKTPKPMLSQVENLTPSAPLKTPGEFIISWPYPRLRSPQTPPSKEKMTEIVNEVDENEECGDVFAADECDDEEKDENDDDNDENDESFFRNLYTTPPNLKKKIDTPTFVVKEETDYLAYFDKMFDLPDDSAVI